MGKTYKDGKNFIPSEKPKNKGSQKNKRVKDKTIKQREEDDKE